MYSVKLILVLMSFEIGIITCDQIHHKKKWKVYMYHKQLIEMLHTEQCL